MLRNSFAKCSILDVWQGSKYASVSIYPLQYNKNKQMFGYILSNGFRWIPVSNKH